MTTEFNDEIEMWKKTQAQMNGDEKFKTLLKVSVESFLSHGSCGKQNSKAWSQSRELPLYQNNLQIQCSINHDGIFSPQEKKNLKIYTEIQVDLNSPKKPEQKE